MSVLCSYTSYILAKIETGNKETYTNRFIANVILFSSYGLSCMSEYMEHVRCISTSSLDRDRTSKHATDVGKTPDKYWKHTMNKVFRYIDWNVERMPGEERFDAWRKLSFIFVCLLTLARVSRDLLSNKPRGFTRV